MKRQMKSEIILRWVLVLPGAIIGSSAIYAIAKLLLSITTYDDGVELSGIGKEISFDLYTIGYGLLFGYSYIIIGKAIAPSHGRQVSVALTVLPIIYAVLQLGFLAANVFYHFGKPQVTAFLEGPSAAVGAFLSAKRQWRLMCLFPREWKRVQAAGI